MTRFLCCVLFLIHYCLVNYQQAVLSRKNFAQVPALSAVINDASEPRYYSRYRTRRGARRIYSRTRFHTASLAAAWEAPGGRRE